MVVSAGLQKYFDGKRGKKGDIDNKFKSISWDIDPRFLQSFEKFRARLLGIVEEYPESEDFVWAELSDLETSLQISKRQHSLKKAATIIDAAEVA